MPRNWKVVEKKKKKYESFMPRKFVALTNFMSLICYYAGKIRKSSDGFRGFRKRPVAWNRLK